MTGCQQLLQKRAGRSSKSRPGQGQRWGEHSASEVLQWQQEVDATRHSRGGGGELCGGGRQAVGAARRLGGCHNGVGGLQGRQARRWRTETTSWVTRGKGSSVGTVAGEVTAEADTARAAAGQQQAEQQRPLTAGLRLVSGQAAMLAAAQSVWVTQTLGAAFSQTVSPYDVHEPPFAGGEAGAVMVASPVVVGAAAPTIAVTLGAL